MKLNLTMRLLIENKILLKEYARAWTPTGWGKAPKGWTPDECSEWVHARSEEMMAEARAKELVTSREFTKRAAAAEYGKVLYKLKKPWPGWVPIIAQHDRKISKAYRQYFVELEQCPPDGFYTFHNGKMRPMEGE